MCMDITSLILDISHNNECPLKVQGRSCMSCWRLVDVVVLDLVAVRLSPGGLCLDDGIHHRESPERLWLVAKTPFMLCVGLVCGGPCTYCLLHTLFMFLKCFRKLNSILKVFYIFIVSRSCWRIKDTIIERLGSFLVFYYITILP